MLRIFCVRALLLCCQSIIQDGLQTELYAPHHHYIIRLSPNFPVPRVLPWKKINESAIKGADSKIFQNSRSLFSIWGNVKIFTTTTSKPEKLRKILFKKERYLRPVNELPQYWRIISDRTEGVCGCRRRLFEHKSECKGKLERPLVRKSTLGGPPTIRFSDYSGDARTLALLWTLRAHRGTFAFLRFYFPLTAEY